MPRTCTVCKHKKRGKIDAVKGDQDGLEMEKRPTYFVLQLKPRFMLFDPLEEADKMKARCRGKDRPARQSEFSRWFSMFSPRGADYTHLAAEQMRVFADLAKDLGQSLGLWRAPIPKRVRTQLILKFNCRCQYCSRLGDQQGGPDGRTWHVDHIFPVSRGGDDSEDNLTLSCATCNLRKHDAIGGAWQKNATRSA